MCEASARLSEIADICIREITEMARLDVTVLPITRRADFQ